MRYFLIIAGLLAIVVGLLTSPFAAGAVWIQIGAVFIAIGLATCEIIATITKATSGEQVGRFRAAARTGDSKTKVDLLKDGGIPEDVAERTVESVLEDPDTFLVRRPDAR
jgi:hypothetical protein